MLFHWLSIGEDENSNGIIGQEVGHTTPTDSGMEPAEPALGELSYRQWIAPEAYGQDNLQVHAS